MQDVVYDYESDLSGLETDILSYYEGLTVIYLIDLCKKNRGSTCIRLIIDSI